MGRKRVLHTSSGRPIYQELNVREPCPRCAGKRFRFYPTRRRWWLALCCWCGLEVERESSPYHPVKTLA